MRKSVQKRESKPTGILNRHVFGELAVAKTHEGAPRILPAERGYNISIITVVNSRAEREVRLPPAVIEPELSAVHFASELGCHHSHLTIVSIAGFWPAFVHDVN